jgi:hypothetical protein
MLPSQVTALVEPSMVTFARFVVFMGNGWDRLIFDVFIKSGASLRYILTAQAGVLVVQSTIRGSDWDSAANRINRASVKRVLFIG